MFTGTVSAFDFVLPQEPVTATEPTEVDPTSNMMLLFPRKVQLISE